MSLTSSSQAGAYLAGSDAPEKTVLKIGFVPLTDCAPVVVARQCDFGRRHGIAIELCKLPSWAAVRDALLSGEIDAAHTLYGLVYGVQLGLGGVQADMGVLMTLSQNGQAITLSNQLAGRLQAVGSLREALESEPRKPVLAQTFPTGTHAMWLYYWLASQDVHPLYEVRSVVIPPPQMSDALARGELDGFCAGEPWHAVAQARKVGQTVVSSSEIWPDHPEKVLACRRDFAALYPNAARALIKTVLEACRWLEVPANRQQAAGWLATEGITGAPVDLIAPRLLGDYGSAALRQPPRPLRFFAGGEVNFPYLSDGLWFLSQYRRWGMLRREADLAAIAAAVNQTALYAEAAGALGVDLPPSVMRHSVLIGGLRWDGGDAEAYARSFAIAARD